MPTIRLHEITLSAPAESIHCYQTVTLCKVGRKPFQVVCAETYDLQSGYLHVKVGEQYGFVHAKHIAWQQDGVRYKHLSDDQ